MLLANFRVVRAAYEGLQAVLPAPSNHQGKSENAHQRNPSPATVSSFGKDFALLPNEEEPEQHESHSSRDSAVGSATCAAGADNEETGKWSSRGAAKSVRRESRIVLWALRDAAARVVQEETRGYARRRRWLSGPRQRQGASTEEANIEGAFHESSTREDEDVFDDGYQAVDGGLPWGLNARLSTAGTATTSPSTSSTRCTTARASTARTTTAGFARRRTQGGRSVRNTIEDRNTFDGGNQPAEGGLRSGLNARMSTALTATTAASSTTNASTATTRTTAAASSARIRTPGGSGGQSASSVSNRSPTTVDSAGSPTWHFPNMPGTGLDYLGDCTETPEQDWVSEEAREGGRLHTQQAEIASRFSDRVVARWPLLHSEEQKKR